MAFPFLVAVASAAVMLGTLAASLYAALIRSGPPILQRLFLSLLAVGVTAAFAFGALTGFLGWSFLAGAGIFAATFLGAVLLAPAPISESVTSKRLARHRDRIRGALQQRSGRARSIAPGIFVLMAAGYAAAAWSTPAVLTPDSRGYLEFHNARTSGYPIFLEAVRSISDGDAAVPNAQVLLAAAAFAFLGWSVRRAFGSLLAGVALAALLMTIPDLTELNAQVMTESVFVSLLCVTLGCLALTARRPDWRTTAAAALACGLAITVRPAAISLLPLFPIALWLIWPRTAGQRMRLTAAAVIPIALCIGAESAIWQTRHGAGAPDGLVNRHMFAKALLIAPDPRLNDPGLAAALDYGRAAMEPGRELIAGAPNLQTRALLLRNFEVAAQYPTYFRELAPTLWPIWDERGIKEDDFLGQAGWAAMRGAPGAWALNALTHYWGLWTAYWAYRPDFIASYKAYTEDLEKTHLFADARVFQTLPQSGRRVRLMMLAGLAVSLAATALAAGRRLRGSARADDGRLAAAALSGLAVHGHFLLIGLTGVATPRYALVMLPALALCGFLLINWAMEQAWSRMENQQTYRRQCEAWKSE